MRHYVDKLKTQLYWWLNKTRPFYINNEYKIELLNINRQQGSVKILVTNLKDSTETTTIIGG